MNVFHPPYILAGPGACVFDGVTATPSCPFPLWMQSLLQGLGLGCVIVEGSGLSPATSKSRRVARASRGKSAYRREVEFWPGRRYFPAFDVLFTHLYEH